jgi:hypothetical protein
MIGLISKFKVLALYKKKGMHKDAVDMLRELTNDEIKEFYRFLNQAYYESGEDEKHMILEDICYFSSIRTYMPTIPPRVVMATVSGKTEWRVYYEGEVIGRFESEEWAKKFYQLINK